MSRHAVPVRCALLLPLATACAATSVAMPPGCDPPVASIFGTVGVGTLVADTVDLEWTVFETPDVRAYRIARIPAAAAGPASSRSAAAILLAEVEPDGEHGWSERRYELTDTAPPGEWVYELHVRTRDGFGCTVQTDPLVVGAHRPCGAVDVCDQVAQSFSCAVASGPGGPTVQLEWGSCAESRAVGGYRVTRVPVGCVGLRCGRRLATVHALGSCGEPQLHRVTDAPKQGEYVYRLQVLDRRQRPVCTVESAPQQVP